MVNDVVLKRLQGVAAELRFRIVSMMGPGKVHHFGGSLSSADIITALYFYKMRYDPNNPGWPERDRFIMSKGHSVPVQYAALAMLGVFPMEELSSLKVLGTRLQGHPAMHLLPGIEGCTGALGEGLSYANGMALAGRVKGLKYQVYCLIGDGELQEGQIWEAAMTTPKKHLTNVTAIIDRNRLKAMDEADSAKTTDLLVERWSAFGWVAREVDGHDLKALCDGLDWATTQQEKPALLLCNTIKGKGISFIENQAAFHNAAIPANQFVNALGEVESAYKRFEVAK
jgi:transketolase